MSQQHLPISLTDTHSPPAITGVRQSHVTRSPATATRGSRDTARSAGRGWIQKGMEAIPLRVQLSAKIHVKALAITKMSQKTALGGREKPAHPHGQWAWQQPGVPVDGHGEFPTWLGASQEHPGLLGSARVVNEAQLIRQHTPVFAFPAARLFIPGMQEAGQRC